MSVKTAAAAAGDDLMCLSCTPGCPPCDAACLTSQQFTLKGNLYVRAANVLANRRHMTVRRLHAGK